MPCKFCQQLDQLARIDRLDQVMIEPGMTMIKHRHLSVVTVCDFSGSATCYAAANGRVRPEADL